MVELVNPWGLINSPFYPAGIVYEVVVTGRRGILVNPVIRLQIGLKYYQDLTTIVVTLPWVTT